MWLGLSVREKNVTGTTKLIYRAIRGRAGKGHPAGRFSDDIVNDATAKSTGAGDSAVVEAFPANGNDRVTARSRVFAYAARARRSCGNSGRMKNVRNDDGKPNAPKAKYLRVGRSAWLSLQSLPRTRSPAHREGGTLRAVIREIA